jgi:uncharacterized protein (TIGR02391 family)
MERRLRKNMGFFHETISDPERLLELEPEELAGVVLQYLNSLDPSAGGTLHRYNFSINPSTVEGYAGEYHEPIRRALMEAWVWLEREGLLAPKPGDHGGFLFVTRRGQTVATPEKLAAYRRANLLPRGLLHPSLVQSVWATFLRGDYDTAVFQAFKTVEVQDRRAADLGLDVIGVDLMRKAFSVPNGPLTDQSVERGEQQALSDLFAGAIGSYKNSTSHRALTIEPVEAVEMIILASHLLGIIDKRHTA